MAKYNLTVYRDNFPWNHCLLWAPYKHRGEECTKSSGMPGEGQILMFHKMNLSTWYHKNECIYSVIGFIFKIENILRFQRIVYVDKNKNYKTDFTLHWQVNYKSPFPNTISPHTNASVSPEQQGFKMRQTIWYTYIAINRILIHYSQVIYFE